MNSKPIGLASDHAGYDLKMQIREYLDARGMSYEDFGTDSTASCDYSDFGHALGRAVDEGRVDIGIAVCGSGEGISMTLNKHQKVRAGLVWNTDVTHLIRQHNNANVIVFPGRFISKEDAYACLDEFFATPFEGGRHQARIDKIPLQ